MSLLTNIQWCDDTCNPSMGCSTRCELRPTPAKVRAEARKFFAAEFPALAAATIDRVLDEQIASYNATEILQRRHLIVEAMATALPATAMKALKARFKRVLDKWYICYAHQLHLRRGSDILNPDKVTHPGYAAQFEKVKLCPGRMALSALSADLFATVREYKPWLDYFPRSIFVSDMGDALSEEIPFEYLKAEIIDVVTSGRGRAHLWLWLTKNPKRMAAFARWLQLQHIDWPDNLVAMTSVTSQDTAIRIKHLLEVPARFRGLSVEPLWEDVTLPLDGIDLCIVGGQSGCGARPFDLAWAEHLLTQCRASNTAFFLKQLGARPICKGVPLKLKDPEGGDWSDWPTHLQIREMPQGFRSLRFASLRGMAIAPTPSAGELP